MQPFLLQDGFSVTLSTLCLLPCVMAYFEGRNELSKPIANEYTAEVAYSFHCRCSSSALPLNGQYPNIFNGQTRFREILRNFLCTRARGYVEQSQTTSGCPIYDYVQLKVKMSVAFLLVAPLI
jgi:hypothetical protein